VRFLLELALLAVLAWWGFGLDAPLALRIAAGLAAPAVALAVWSRWIAPRAERRLADPLRLAVEGVLWLAGAGALWVAWRPRAAVAFLAAALVTAALVRVWPEPVPGLRRR
jgi:hypothetical protein